jgi:DNA segregation ATPase FtsK/SpoIIIE, S-DNA-T family
MIFELVSCAVMGGLAVKAHLSKSGAGNDSQKLNKIFTLSGLNVKDGKQTLTTQLLRKKNYEWGIEYRYRIPLGRSFEDYQAKLKTIEAGLNTRTFKLELKDLQSLKLDRHIIQSIRSLYTHKLTHRKEIELSYDGLLIVRVYNDPFPSEIKWSEELLKNGTWSVAIGMNRKGIIYHDFDKRKSLLVAGVPGSGKSVLIKLIITSLILQNPDDVTFSLIDLKEGAAFSRFKNARQVVDFATNEIEAMEVLKKVKERMSVDYRKIVEDGFEDVTEAKTKKRHFLIIDEAADLADNRVAMELITEIVRKGRGGGYYCIYATQYPSMQAVSPQIKRNIPARLSYVLDSSSASVTVLDSKGAEELPDMPGRGIYKDTKRVIVQTPFMNNKTIEELIKPFITPDKGVKPIVKRETRKNIIEFKETGLS